MFVAFGIMQAVEKFTDGQGGMDKLRDICKGWDDATIADVRGIFQMLDDNGDGVLDMNELWVNFVVSGQQSNFSASLGLGNLVRVSSVDKLILWETITTTILATWKCYLQ